VSTFKDLAIGKTFRFASELELGWQGARGPWIKITPRKYIDESGQREYQVGSIRAAVREVAAAGSAQ
jgi:hypothetical protein